MMMYIRVQLAIKDILTHTLSIVAEKRVLQLEKYIKTLACMVKNRVRIRQSIQNEMMSLRNINSRKIEKYVRGATFHRKH